MMHPHRDVAHIGLASFHRSRDVPEVVHDCSSPEAFVAALPMPIAILARVAGVRLLFIAVHESVHAVAAIVLGYRRITVRIFCRQPYTKVSNIGSHDHGLVRHAGWIASLVTLSFVRESANSVPPM